MTDRRNKGTRDREGERGKKEIRGGERIKRNESERAERKE